MKALVLVEQQAVFERLVHSRLGEASVLLHMLSHLSSLLQTIQSVVRELQALLLCELLRDARVVDNALLLLNDLSAVRLGWCLPRWRTLQPLDSVQNRSPVYVVAYFASQSGLFESHDRLVVESDVQGWSHNLLVRIR